MTHPIIIQGGMGVAVSNWRLAGAVAKAGQLGVVSGTLLAGVLARRLQDGDVDGYMRHALGQFPIAGVAERVIAQFFIPGGKTAHARYKLTPMPTLVPNPALIELTVAANFVEVFLAKEGHSGLVGINLLEKIQLVTLPSLYGAMLAGVDYVLMGAGIPREIPGVLDRFAQGQSASLRIDVRSATPAAEYSITFEPRSLSRPDLPGYLATSVVPALPRPYFLAIVSSAALATTLARKSTGRVDGFVIETDTAGGHNAPPRGVLELNPQGEPVYGSRDAPDLEKFRALNLPFWLAGSFGHPGKLSEAIRLGAQGIQVGTAFAFCQESGISPEIKEQVIEQALQENTRVFTDPSASPTGFPFKVVQLPGTISEPKIYAERKRVCDLGYLRQSYQTAEGKIAYRCAAEPVEDFVQKQGHVDDTVGRKCLCNGLLATVGYAQPRGTNEFEPALVTAGNEIVHLARFLPRGGRSYSAQNVISTLVEVCERCPKQESGAESSPPQEGPGPHGLSGVLN